MEIREAFFYDACFIITIDRQVVNKEVDFLDEFAKDIGIQADYKFKMYQYFWIKLG